MLFLGIKIEMSFSLTNRDTEPTDFKFGDPWSIVIRRYKFESHQMVFKSTRL